MYRYCYNIKGKTFRLADLITGSTFWYYFETVDSDKVLYDHFMQILKRPFSFMLLNSSYLNLKIPVPSLMLAFFLELIQPN